MVGERRGKPWEGRRGRRMQLQVVPPEQSSLRGCKRHTSSHILHPLPSATLQHTLCLLNWSRSEPSSLPPSFRYQTEYRTPAPCHQTHLDGGRVVTELSNLASEITSRSDYTGSPVDPKWSAVWPLQVVWKRTHTPSAQEF